MSTDQQPPVFTVNNKHTAECGTPPRIDGNEANRYYGYFENTVREQFLFVYDYETKTGTLWCGDAGWERSFQVEDGKVPHLSMDQVESMWLEACWRAARAFK